MIEEVEAENQFHKVAYANVVSQICSHNIGPTILYYFFVFL
jgi:hypothetical protein